MSKFNEVQKNTTKTKSYEGGTVYGKSLEDEWSNMLFSCMLQSGFYESSEEVEKSRMDLRPALSWKSHVIHVKEVGPGLGVSYGATYVTEKPSTRIATVSIGYADGYENRPAVGRYTPCWLNLATDAKENTSKHDTKSAYEECMDTIEHSGLFEAYKGNERFERLVENLKAKISK